MIEWALVGVVMACTVAGDLLQSLEMKQIGEIHDFRPSGIRRLLMYLSRRKYMLLAIFFMAVSFFAFMKLVTVADLSFAVPATAGSFVLETILARVILKEHIERRRWAGAFLVACGVALLAH